MFLLTVIMYLCDDSFEVRVNFSFILVKNVFFFLNCKEFLKLLLSLPCDSDIL